MRMKVAATILFSVVSAVHAAQDSPSGAKELFYDPSDDSVTSSKESPSAAARPATKPKPSPTKRISIGEYGRRQVNTAVSVSLAARATLPAATQERPQVVGISYWIELQDAQGGAELQVTNERVFHSGERIRLHFRSNVDGHIALLQLGASGSAAVLFPDPSLALNDGALVANEDRILPAPSRWFRFDDTAGTERILVLFARNSQDIEHFPAKTGLSPAEAGTLVASARGIQGSKDLKIETETKKVSEIGTYGVNVAGKPVVLEVTLKHQ